jgi:hypothetical protein
MGALLFLSTGATTQASASSGITLTGVINGQRLATSSQSNPVHLYPLRPTDIVVNLDNHTSSPVHVATVRMSGEVIGLTFFSFDNSVAFTVPPFHSATTRYSIPLVGLNGQATGLIDSSLSVLDPGQQVVASQGFVADVRGSLTSVYGVFGLAVALLTVFAFALVLLEMARHGLSANRFRRGLYFVVPGLGLGLVLVFTLSATRVFVPSLSHWVPIVVFSAVIFFLIGFLTPDPRVEDEEDDDEMLLESRMASPKVATPATTPAPSSAPQPASGFGSRGDASSVPSTPERTSDPVPASPAAPATQSSAPQATPSPARQAGSEQPGPAPQSGAPAPATVTDPGSQPPAREATDAGRSPR